MTPAQLYDFSTPLERAIGDVFAAAFAEDAAQTAAIWTPLRAAEFQKQRPRVELIIVNLVNLGWLKPAAGVPARCGFLRDKARKGTLMVHVVTAAGIQVHRAYVAQTLFVLDTLGLAMNATDKMPFHSVQCVKVNSTPPKYEPEQGNFETALSVELDASIKESAWPDLQT